MLTTRKLDKKTPCGALYFATLTHPKLAHDKESAGAAVSRLLAEWRKLTNRRGFRRHVAGYVRAVEVTWSRSSGTAGWHAHLHIVIELNHKTSQWDAWHYLRSNWCDITGGSENAQDWQYLSAVSVHQLAKYITKPFQLPPEQAVLFFREMAHRRIIEGSGTWRRWRLDDKPAESSMLEQRCTLTELCVLASKRETIDLHWRERSDGSLEAVGDVRPLRDGEKYHSVVFEAVELVERLRLVEAEKKRAEENPRPSSRDGPTATRARPPRPGTPGGCGRPIAPTPRGNRTAASPSLSSTR